MDLLLTVIAYYRLPSAYHQGTRKVERWIAGDDETRRLQPRRARPDVTCSLG